MDPVTISEARRRLFDLFERVTSRRPDRVVIRHRDGDREAVLIDREVLEGLERRAAEATTTSFDLFGSATLHTSPDDVLSAVRAEQRALGEAKVRRSKKVGA